MFNQIRSQYLMVILALILAACQSPPASPEPVVETLVVTEVVEATSVDVIQVMTPTPEPEGLRTLVICIGTEPDTLYPFGSNNLAEAQIMEAIAGGDWGAFDNNSFAYQPVILEKLPSVADGDAALTTVVVTEGDAVIDASGEIVILESAANPPQMLFPAGGGDPTPYEGGAFEMEQISATFQLLPGLLWSDGTLLTAADSVYAFNLLADPDTPIDEFKVERTASYEALDELTTKWTGLPGFMDTEYYTNFFGPAPEHIWGQYSAKELIEAEESHLKPVGWGPYMVEEWIRGEGITLKKNPNYSRAAENLPKFDTLIFRFTGDNASANIADLLSGECDIIYTTSPLITEGNLLLDLENSGQIKATFATGTVWHHLDFGIQPRKYDDGYQVGVDRPDFFSDVRTRRAFTMCLDRQALVDTVMVGQSIVIDSYLPPQHPLYNSEVAHYEFDVTAGRALLEEIGWQDDDGDPSTPRIARSVENVPDGTSLVVGYDTVSSPIFEQVASILQETLAECGIQINPQYYSRSEIFAVDDESVLFGRRFDLGQFAWLTGVTPPCQLYLSDQTPGPTGETWVSIQDGMERIFDRSGWGGQNNPGFVDGEYDAACNIALGSLPDQQEYEAAHLEAQRIFAEQLPVAPLFLVPKVAATRPDLCGLIMDPTNPSEFWNIEEFDYGEGCEE